MLRGYLLPGVVTALMLSGAVNLHRQYWPEHIIRASEVRASANDTTYKTNRRFVYVTDTVLWVKSGWWGADTSVVPDTAVIPENSFIGITRTRTSGGKIMTISPDTIGALTALDSAAADDSASNYGMTAAYLQGVGLPSVDPVPLGAPGTWTLTFEDEFEGTNLDTLGTWIMRPPWHPSDINDEDQYYLDVEGNTIVVDNGVLYLITKDSTANGKDYQSAEISSYDTTYNDGFRQRYGFFEMKVKINKSDPGLWPALWMMGYPNGTWPGAGEFDLLEAPYAPTSYYATTHWYDGGNQAEGYKYEPDFDLSDDYHTYGVYWDTGNVRMYLDGEMISWQQDTAAVPDSTMYFLLGTAVCDGGGCWGGPVTGGTEFPDTMFVDYVRAWSGTGTHPDYYVQLDAETTDPQIWEAHDTVGGNTVTATTDEAYEGSRSWEVAWAGDSVAANVTRGAGVSDDSAWLNFAFMVDATYAAPTWNSVLIGEVNEGNNSGGDGIPLVKFWLGQQAEGTFLLYAHRYAPNYRPGFPEMTVINPITVDQWYDIHVLWHGSDSTLKIYVDSTLAETKNDTTLNSTRLDRFTVGGIRGNQIPTAGKLYIDNVRIGPDLEPVAP